MAGPLSYCDERANFGDPPTVYAKISGGWFISLLS